MNTLKTIKDALESPKLEETMMGALHKNQTWDLVELPHGKKVVGCKWVFATKFKANGSINRYKAKLVATRFTQTYGIDY